MPSVSWSSCQIYLQQAFPAALSHAALLPSSRLLVTCLAREAAWGTKYWSASCAADQTQCSCPQIKHSQVLSRYPDRVAELCHTKLRNFCATWYMPDISCNLLLGAQVKRQTRQAWTYHLVHRQPQQHKGPHLADMRSA